MSTTDKGAAAFQAVGFLMVGTGLMTIYAAYRGLSLKSVLLSYIPGSGVSAGQPLSTAPTTAPAGTGPGSADVGNTPAQTGGPHGAIFGTGGPVP